MNILKLKRASTKVLLAASGAIYLTTFSNLELNTFIKYYAVVIPAQLLALSYGLYLIYQQKTNTRQYRPPN